MARTPPLRRAEQRFDLPTTGEGFSVLPQGSSPLPSERDLRSVQYRPTSASGTASTATAVSKEPQVPLRKAVYARLGSENEATREDLFQTFVTRTGLGKLCRADTPINGPRLLQYYNDHYGHGIRGWIARALEPDRARRLREIANEAASGQVQAKDLLYAMVRLHETPSRGNIYAVKSHTYYLLDRDAVAFATVLGLLREPGTGIVRLPAAPAADDEGAAAGSASNVTVKLQNLSKGLIVQGIDASDESQRGDAKMTVATAVLDQLGIYSDSRRPRFIEPEVLHHLCKVNPGLRKALEKIVAENADEGDSVKPLRRTNVWSGTWRLGLFGRFLAPASVGRMSEDRRPDYTGITFVELAAALVTFNKAQDEGRVSQAALRVLSQVYVRDQSLKDARQREVPPSEMRDGRSWSRGASGAPAVEADARTSGEIVALLDERNTASKLRNIARHVVLAPVWIVEAGIATAVAGVAAAVAIGTSPFWVALIPLELRARKRDREITLFVQEERAKLRADSVSWGDDSSYGDDAQGLTTRARYLRVHSDAALSGSRPFTRDDVEAAMGASPIVYTRTAVDRALGRPGKASWTPAAEGHRSGLTYVPALPEIPDELDWDNEALEAELGGAPSSVSPVHRSRPAPLKQEDFMPSGLRTGDQPSQPTAGHSSAAVRAAQQRLEESKASRQHAAAAMAASQTRRSDEPAPRGGRPPGGLSRDDDLESTYGEA